VKKALLILLLTSAFAWSQDTGNQPAPSSGATAPADDQAAAADHPTNAFGEEFRGHVSLTGGVSFEQQYDDNVFSGTFPQQSGNVGVFSGRMSLNAQRPHSRWQMFYAPTLRVAETGPDNSGGSHQGGISLDSQLSARTTFAVQGAVNYLNSRHLPSQQYLFANGQAIPVFAPGIVTTGTHDLSPQGDISMSHQFSASDSLIASIEGQAHLLSPENNARPSAALLDDNYSVGATFGYQHHLNARTTLGASVQHRYLAYSSNTPHLNNEIASFTFSHAFTPRWKVAGEVGPSFLIRRGQQTTSYSASASLTRQSALLNYGFTYFDGVQSSAVAQASTTFRNVGASISRTFLRRWTAGSTFGYSQSSSAFTRGNASSYSGSANLRFALTDQLSFSGSYSRLSQLSTGSFSAVPPFDRNLYSFGIYYNLKEILRY
jgi:hypothetical protein